jgi:hypothetical protein
MKVAPLCPARQPGRKGTTQRAAGFYPAAGFNPAAGFYRTGGNNPPTADVGATEMEITRLATGAGPLSEAFCSFHDNMVYALWGRRPAGAVFVPVPCPGLR